MINLFLNSQKLRALEHALQQGDNILIRSLWNAPKALVAPCTAGHGKTCPDFDWRQPRRGRFSTILPFFPIGLLWIFRLGKHCLRKMCLPAPTSWENDIRSSMQHFLSVPAVISFSRACRRAYNV